jgi:parallel beta-helix repeat protein
MSQANVLLDCRQATLTTAASILLNVWSSNVTILGGHWIGQTGCATAIELIGSSATNCLIDGLEVENFEGSLQGVIFGAYASSYNTIQNCSIHDNSNNYCINFGSDFGHNKVINCKIYNSRAGIFICPSSGYNEITGCEFYNLNGHSMYNDGGATAIGHNAVHGCRFHDQLYGAGFQIKTFWNKIYNNSFYNFTTDSPAFAIYSELANYYANDNEIYNNTFINVRMAFWIGHGDIVHSPTNRNKIHDNYFENVNKCIALNPSGLDNGPSTQHVDDTWIYYNKFVNCGDIFPTTNCDGATLIVNTVIAYNNFGKTVTNLSILSYNNTMVYGNIGMTDFNVPSPMPIPPRA